MTMTMLRMTVWMMMSSVMMDTTIATMMMMMRMMMLMMRGVMMVNTILTMLRVSDNGLADNEVGDVVTGVVECDVHGDVVDDGDDDDYVVVIC